MEIELFSLAIGVMLALFAGLIKGMVGFAMPLIMISGLSAVISPELALAGLIFPTLLSNAMQAFRQGFAGAGEAIIKHRVFLLSGMVFLFFSAQLVTSIPAWVMLLAIGIPVSLFALTQLLGKNLTLPQPPSRNLEIAVGGFSGFLGGLSGIWGPTTVAWLTARATPKAEQIRVQGIIFGLGTIALTMAHIGSGVLDREGALLSLSLVAPAALGMWIGFRLSDRIDQGQFRKLTLIILLISGANLIRRAFLLM